MPILVLANKFDKEDKMQEIDIVKGMNLDYLIDNPWAIIPVSAKTGHNMD